MMGTRIKQFYSRTSRKQPPKLSSLGGCNCLQEVVAYERLDHV